MLKKILALCALLVALFVAVFSWSYAGAWSRVPVTGKVIALTFDDGPNPPYTAELLAVLRRHGVTATFFPKGRNVEAFPQAAREVVAQGHEIGNHSYHHLPMTAVSKQKMLTEIAQAQKIIHSVMGVRPTLFRPPFGAQFVGVKRALDELGLTSVLASSHGTDWEVTDARTIAAAVLEKAAPGGIILLHDGHGDVAEPQDQNSRQPSVEAADIIIATLHDQGYRFVTVSELLSMAE